MEPADGDVFRNIHERPKKIPMTSNRLTTIEIAEDQVVRDLDGTRSFASLLGGFNGIIERSDRGRVVAAEEVEGPTGAIVAAG